MKSLIDIDVANLDDYEAFAQVNDNWDIQSYVNMKYDLNTAIAFGKFYFPEFIEHKNCIILKSRFNIEIFQDWYIELKGNISEIEKMCNLYEIKDYFHMNSKEISSNQIDEFGKLLQANYEFNLKFLYPERKFCVDIFKEDEMKYITLYQKL